MPIPPTDSGATTAAPADRGPRVWSTNRRIRAVADPIIPVLGALIDRHPGTLSLGQGMVAFGPPPDALARTGDALGDLAIHQYQQSDGLPSLVERFAEKLRRENHTPLGGRRVIVAAGGNMAFLELMLVLLDPGDEVVFPAPYYFNYPMAVDMAGGRSVVAATDRDYQLDLEAIERAITPRTRAIVTISPNNPSGAVYPASVLRAVNALCADRGLYHVSDEVYEYFTFGDTPHYSPASEAGTEAHTIALYSMSKAYGMAGWRIGFMVVPEALYEPLLKVQDTNVVCPTIASQVLASHALDVGRAYCDAQVRPLRELRDRALARLRDIGDACAVPPSEGALYLLPRVATDLDSMTVATRLVEDFGVAVVPGAAFGLTDGCYLRVAYGAVDPRELDEALARLTRGLAHIAGERPSNH
mgnify:CR=1 FL=1